MSTYLQYNNHMILHPTDSSKYISVILDPLNPLKLPEYTIRLLYKDGVTPTFNKGTATQVSSSPNVWDLTYNNSNWRDLLSGSMDGGQAVHRDSLLKVLGANTTGVTNMSGMLCTCEYLNEVALFDMSSVTTTQEMFLNCERITSVPDYDTRNVTNFVEMFGQSGLVVAPNLDTRSATDMSIIFFRCMDLTYVPPYNTSSVTDMGGMFWQCQSLTSVPMMDTSNVTDMNTMFDGCLSLTTVPLFDTSSVTDMGRMFHECRSLTTIPLFDTSSVTDMDRAFAYCYNVTSGALALYQQASTQSTQPSHLETFYGCGSNTPSGAAELAQIPDDWK